MSIRTDFIDAKLNGKLQEATTEKLGQYIENFQDYSMFVDVVKENEKIAADPTSIRNLLLASSLLGGAAFLGGRHLKLKQAHNQVIDQLLADPAYTDKKKVEDIYKMLTQFAPRVSSNITFAKSVMDQLYNSPMISAPMISEIVRVEQGAADSASIIPHTKDILTSAGNVAKMST